MRRVCIVFACCALALLAAPTRADAWWDFVEEFSGAGPFKGFDFDSRVICIVDKAPDKPVGTDTNTPADTDKTVRIATIGVVYSSCGLKKDERRRASIDLGMRFVWRDNDPRFANGHRISLTTAEPAISWSLVDGRDGHHPYWDWVDYGVGAGAYWISSTEFPSISGAFLEPVRLDVHAPMKFNKWAQVPVFRFGMLVFPGGFKPTAFAPRPDAERRISRDWVKTYAIYADLGPLLDRLR